MKNNLFACIMAGGTGTRFWPLSTIKKPKQLLAIGTDKPLLNLTLERISKLIYPENQLIVTGDAIVEAIEKAAGTIPPENIISEPLRRNTAPCILLAAKLIYQRNPDGIMCVLPSDHLIENSDRFLSMLESAATLASEQDILITLGITPNSPETGYGYIEFGNPAGESAGWEYFKVKAFHEKPDLKKAKEYLKAGNFYWNSGMFVWSVRSILKSIQKHLPEICKAFDPLDDLSDPADLKEIIAGIYLKFEGISIDYGVMEKADNIVGFPSDIGWNDVGAWTCLEDLVKKDSKGNVHQGDYLSIDSEGCIVSSEGGITVTIGAKDLIVVHTPNATLVCEKNRAQEIKRIFELAQKKKLEKYL